jgi:hypothetical protein
MESKKTEFFLMKLRNLCKKYVEKTFKRESEKIRFDREFYEGLEKNPDIYRSLLLEISQEEFFEYKPGILFPKSFSDFISFFRAIEEDFHIIYNHRDLYSKFRLFQSIFCDLLELMGSIRPVFFLDRENMLTICILSNGDQVDLEKLKKLKLFIKRITSTEEILKQRNFFNTHYTLCNILDDMIIKFYEYTHKTPEDIEVKKIDLLGLKNYVSYNKKSFRERDILLTEYLKRVEILSEVSHLLTSEKISGL